VSFSFHLIRSVGESIGLRIACAAILLGVFGSAAEQPPLRQLAIVEVPGQPGFEDAVFANGMLLVAHPGAGTVDIFDPAKRRLVAQVQKIAEPRGIAVDERGGLAYIATAGTNSITVLNTKTWKVEGSIGLKHTPDAVALVPEMKSLLVSNPANRSVSIVATDALSKQNSELVTIDLAGKPQQIVWDAERRSAYVTLEDRGEIVAVEPAAQKVRSRYRLTASQPTGMAFDPVSRRLFVAVRYAVLQVDPDSGAEVARVPAANGVDTLWLDSSGRKLYSAASDGSVAIIDVTGNTMRVTGEFRASVRGKSLAFDPVNRMMYLTGGREGKSKIVILKPLAGMLPTQGVESARN
jgi:DNA-binding beta-propeller fold protein YncE